MKTLIMDIETIADPSVIPFLPPVEAKGGLKDPVKIAADIEEKKQKQIETLGLDKTTCLICCVTTLDVDEGEPQSIMLDPDTLDVVIEKNLLSVAGTRKLAENDEQQGSYSLKERFDGDFKRVITLPEDVDTDSVEANYEDGVLHIRVAKPVVSQPRQIQINVN